MCVRTVASCVGGLLVASRRWCRGWVGVRRPGSRRGVVLRVGGVGFGSPGICWRPPRADDLSKRGQGTKGGQLFKWGRQMGQFCEILRNLLTVRHRLFTENN